MLGCLGQEGDEDSVAAPLEDPRPTVDKNPSEIASKQDVAGDQLDS